MFRPLVSIVIPVYNGANYLREAIDSALAQTYGDFEVLVVNDGSDDAGATEAVALAYGDKIRYRAKANGGVASALNLGLETMRGEYFSWLSHDDVYFPEKLQSQVDCLSSLADRNTLLFSDYLSLIEPDKEVVPCRADHALISAKPLYAVFGLMIYGCTCLVRRDALERAGFFRDLPATQDYDLWFRLLRRLPFRHMPVPLAYRRIHKDQGGNAGAAMEEADRLWLRLLAELTREEILGVENSPEEFFAQVARCWRRKYIYFPESVNFLYRRIPYGSLLRLSHRWQWQSRTRAKKVLSALGLLSRARRFRNLFLQRA
jgi:glycosyltransferase involved in cell wall biosynthesis